MILVADNIHVINHVVSEAMRKFVPGPINDLAHRRELAGADMININPGYLSAHREDDVVFLDEAVRRRPRFA